MAGGWGKILKQKSLNISLQSRFNMTKLKDEILKVILKRIQRRTAILSRNLITSDSQDKEQIRAALEFEQWMQNCCRQVLAG